MTSLCRRLTAICAAASFALCAAPAVASFHLWQIDQIYSDASGNVQYVEFFTTFSGQEYLTNANFSGGLQSSQGGSTHAYSFPSNLSTAQHSTQNRKFLVATQGFADLNIVTPDYIVPNGFLFISNGTIALMGADSVAYAGLGSNGAKALDRLGNAVATTPTNFAGAIGCVSIPAPTPGGPLDFDGNGFVDALTDGVLLLRYLLGLRGAALTAGAVGACATRSTSDAIQTYIGNQLPPQ